MQESKNPFTPWYTEASNPDKKGLYQCKLVPRTKISSFLQDGLPFTLFLRFDGWQWVESSGRPSSLPTDEDFDFFWRGLTRDCENYNKSKRAIALRDVALLFW